MSKRTMAEIKATSFERMRMALKYREEGMTYKKIGEILGCNRQRAYIIIRRAKLLSDIGML